METQEPFDKKPFIPNKRGILLPILSIAGAVVILIGFPYLFTRLFRMDQYQLNLESGEYYSTQWRLISTYRKEAEEQIRQKDQEILRIQNKLTELDRKQAVLRQIAEMSIQSREQELQESMRERLEAEKTAFDRANMSEQFIETRVQSIQQELKREMQTELEAFRSEAEANLEFQIADLLGERGSLRKELETAMEERNDLAASLKEREAELLATFREEKESLQRQKADVEQSLNELQERRETETMVLRQITSAYGKIQEEIRSTDYTGALVHIQALRDLFQSDAAQSITDSSERIPVELATLDIIEGYIASQRKLTSIDFTESVEIIALFISISDRMIKGNTLYQNGDNAGAKKEYTAVYTLMPELMTMVAAIQDMDKKEILETLDITLEAALQKENEEAIIDVAEVLPEGYDDGVTRMLLSLELLYRKRLSEQYEADRKTAAALQNSIGEYQKEIDLLDREIAAREQEIARLSTTLRESADESSRLSDTNRNLENRIAELERENRTLQDSLPKEYNRGEEAAFSSVTDLLGFYTDEEYNPDMMDEDLKDKIETSSNFRRIADTIEELVALLNQPEPVDISSLKLYGVVSVYALDRIVIEPFSEDSFPSGTQFHIVREVSGNTPELIASGTISDTESGRPVGKIEQIYDDVLPREADRVYLVR